MQRYNDYKFPALKRARIERIVRTIERGRSKATSTPNRRFAFIVLFLILISALFSISIASLPTLLFPLTIIADIILSILVISVGLYHIGRPMEYRRIEEAFIRLGYVDALGLPPEVLDKRNNTRNYELYLINCGKSLTEWQDNRANIETALGVVISKIHLIRGERYVKLICVPSQMAFKEVDEKDIMTEGLKLNIGYKAEGVEVVDLNRTAHILIGGATGSGKTVLLRTILLMLIHRGCDVIICDFKGGIDFPEPIWKRSKLITTYTEVIDSLEKTVYKLEDRKRAFLLYGVKNIEEYNMRNDTECIPHIAIATDEVAEMLDRTGRKEDKVKIDRITELLSTIARLGRAYGIHLIMATQRPDANVIPGQIKNNMTYKACGHADKVLSQIVIDSTDASEIPPDIPGRFITDTGEEFQAIMLSEEWYRRS